MESGLKTPPEVRFRYIDFDLSGAAPAGFALEYSNESLASEVAEALAAYVVAPSGEKELHVGFEREGSSTYRLRLAASAPEVNLEIVISGVDASYVERLAASLREFAYYFVLIGIDARGEFQPVSADVNPLFKNDLMMDGRAIRGVPKREVDWQEVARLLTG